MSMDFLCNQLNEDTSDCSLSKQDIQKCPFLRNINKPTNFSFSSMNFPSHFQLTGAGGPIFEDGPHFNLAFKLFHGEDGVVPLLGNAQLCVDNLGTDVLRQFNPLASKAASINMSAFGPGGPFSFHSFMGKIKNKTPVSSRKEELSRKHDCAKHEAFGNEWLKAGNCPIAKSYRAVSDFLPLMATALQPPPGIKLKCPPAVVAARAALAKTALVKTMRPQPLPTKVLVIGMLGIAANIPLGAWREHTKKFSLSWFTAVHAAIPFIAMFRKSVLMPKTAMALTIVGSILGQIIGSRAERLRLKAKAEKTNLMAATPMCYARCGKQGIIWDPFSEKMSKTSSSSPASMCF